MTLLLLLYLYREDGSETLLLIALCMRSLMGTELMRICVKEDDDFPSVPPGFESYTSFALKRVEENEKNNDKNPTSSSTTTSASESQSTQVGNGVQLSDSAKVSRSLRRRRWINHGKCESGSEEDADCERHDQVSLTWIHLRFGCLDFYCNVYP
jgi:hypothetical protein